MRNLYRLIVTVIFAGSTLSLFAGNPDRVGQAGATELLLNPWARSSGWHGAFTSGIRGVESMRFNVGGLVHLNKTELLFAHSNYLAGTGVSINSFGFGQVVGSSNSSAIGLTIMSMDMGDIPIVTASQPEGGLGSYSPRFVNIGLAFSKKFTNSISGGGVVRIINESIPDASATGVAIDAGIQYVTDITGAGEDKTHFGISLRNVGTPMRFSGDGFSRRTTIEGNDYAQTLEMRSSSFELPSLLNIGFAQDFYLGKDIHKLTAAFNFTSNTFTTDQFQFGLQYSLKDFLQVRGGFLYQDNILDTEISVTPYSGPSGGFSFHIPFGDENDNGFRKSFGVDYSYIATNKWGGIHTFGARLNL